MGSLNGLERKWISSMLHWKTGKKSNEIVMTLKGYEGNLSVGSEVNVTVQEDWFYRKT